jgi:hypothetical protein
MLSRVKHTSVILAMLLSARGSALQRPDWPAKVKCIEKVVFLKYSATPSNPLANQTGTLYAEKPCEVIIRDVPEGWVISEYKWQDRKLK